MENRIDEITQKIYHEGVLKAKEDAEQILSESRSQAEKIINEAKRKKKELIEEAQNEISELQKKSKTDMQLAGKQFLSQLKQKITDLITTKQVDKIIHESMNDEDFIKDVILAMINKWDFDQYGDLEILLPAAKRKELNEFFDSKATEILSKGVVLNFNNGLISGFRIGPLNGGYVISFTEQDFINYFKQNLKDHTRELLFDKTESGI